MSDYEFIFDFASPNACMAHHVLPDIEKRTGIKFDYVPVLLGGVFKMTNNQPPMIAMQGIKNKPEYAQLEMERFIQKYGPASFKMNPHFPVNTLSLMRGAVVAKEEGFLKDYVNAVMKHMWSQGAKMDDPDVIHKALSEEGLDAKADHILERIQQAEIKQLLIKNTEDAVARGVFGIPTFFVGKEMFFGKDSLGLVEEQITASR